MKRLLLVMVMAVLLTLGTVGTAFAGTPGDAVGGDLGDAINTAQDTCEDEDATLEDCIDALEDIARAA